MSHHPYVATGGASYRTGPVRRPSAPKAGRLARVAGLTTEAAVEAACDSYRSSGRASLIKLPTPARAISKVVAGRFTAVWDGKAPIDFAGSLAGGHSVYLEVKASQATNLPLEAHGEPRLGPEQAERLAELHRLGAVVAVLVSLATGATLRRPGPPRRWFLLRWPAWLRAVGAAEAEGRKSISMRMLEQHGRECSLVGGWPDWLTALEVV